MRCNYETSKKNLNMIKKNYTENSSVLLVIIKNVKHHVHKVRNRKMRDFLYLLDVDE